MPSGDANAFTTAGGQATSGNGFLYEADAGAASTAVFNENQCIDLMKGIRMAKRWEVPNKTYTQIGNDARLAFSEGDIIRVLVRIVHAGTVHEGVEGQNVTVGIRLRQVTPP